MLGRLEETPFHLARAPGEGRDPRSDLAPLGIAPKKTGADRRTEAFLLGVRDGLALLAEVSAG
jgi:hypothetical protein